MPVEEEAVSPDYSGSVMVALYPSAQVAAELSVEGGLPAEEMHITLCYLGDDLAALDRPAIESALKEFVSGRSTVESVANGVGMFHVVELDGAEDDQFAQILLLDIPGINEFREDLRSALLDAGAESYENHGFTPHMTLAYWPEAPRELGEPPMTEISFGSIWLAWGDERIEYPLGASLASSISQVKTETDFADGTAAAKALQAEPPEPPETSPSADVERPVAEPQGEGRFEALLVTEGEWTDDGRYITPGAFEWRAPPLPLEYSPSSQDGHDEIVVAGAITTIKREGNEIRAEGVFSADELGQELREAVANGILTWVSIVPANVQGVQKTVGGADEFLKELFAEEDEMPEEVPFDSREPLEIWHKATLISATVLSQPAQGTTWIRVVDEPSQDIVETGEPDGEAEEDSAVAAGGPVKPLAAWFENPGLDGPTPLTVTAEGQIYGHAAAWGQCHTGRQDSCLMAPRSAADYAYFATGVVECKDGSQIPVGQITMGTGHAALGLDASDASRHYDHTGAAVADVSAGEDAYGIWIAGALRPDVSDEAVRVLRASSLSGDWRRLRGGLELVALLTVNVPGFPLRRDGLAASARLCDDEPFALVAAGAMLPGDTEFIELTQVEFGPVEKVLLPMALGELDKRVLKAIDRRVSQ